MSEIKLDDFDFGFSAMTTEEVAEPVKKKQNEKTRKVMDKAVEYKNALFKMHDAIQPLLDNLMKDSDTKPIINWPNRAEKIQEFKDMLQKIIDDTFEEVDK